VVQRPPLPLGLVVWQEPRFGAGRFIHGVGVVLERFAVVVVRLGLAIGLGRRLVGDEWDDWDDWDGWCERWRRTTFD
jgi:hypothetical protein